jgi:hypothetical protein
LQCVSLFEALQEEVGSAREAIQVARLVGGVAGDDHRVVGVLHRVEARGLLVERVEEELGDVGRASIVKMEMSGVGETVVEILQNNLSARFLLLILFEITTAR